MYACASVSVCTCIREREYVTPYVCTSPVLGAVGSIPPPLFTVLLCRRRGRDSSGNIFGFGGVARGSIRAGAYHGIVRRAGGASRSPARGALIREKTVRERFVGVFPFSKTFSCKFVCERFPPLPIGTETAPL